MKFFHLSNIKQLLYFVQNRGRQGTNENQREEKVVFSHFKPTKPIKKKLLHNTFLCCIGIFYALSVAATDELPEGFDLPLFSADYEVFLMGLHISNARRSLKQVGPKRFLLKTEMELTGVASWIRSDVINISSLWEWQDNHAMRPLQYRYAHQGKKNNVASASILTGTSNRHTVRKIRNNGC
ncbi:Uncharacterised protein [Candidatus Venteria ishoeyi]|uniref:Uncharacterized protein n=1 Tax=Candidatus Venteria ishoeyi TaxID=1899563 RepID=A0A1H6F9X7_9GAMM|nr:Uncharacterised protein [Candidatus Venteria ishoeyi]